MQRLSPRLRKGRLPDHGSRKHVVASAKGARFAESSGADFPAQEIKSSEVVLCPFVSASSSR
jgi:hypothetical protein